LLDQRVLGLDQDLDQRFLVQLAQRGDHRQTADQFRDQAELDQIFRLGFSSTSELLFWVLLLTLAEKPMPLFSERSDDLVQAVEARRRR
jgi:hypothetical protein